MKMRRLLCSALLCVCLSAGAFAQKAEPSDDRITDQVSMRLAVDPDVKGGALKVTSKDGVVTITGRVDTDKAKRKAEKLAKKVKGVKSVTNDVTVGPPTG
jgi:hyperosmotically inducible periplasmic protein